jgi:hypothetical protein
LDARDDALELEHPRFHFVPLPKRAAWLNLIAGFWKTLQDPPRSSKIRRQRALAGRACTSTQEVDHALPAGIADGNQQPTPFLWGRPPKPKPTRQFTRSYVYRICGTTHADLYSHVLPDMRQQTTAAMDAVLS